LQQYGFEDIKIFEEGSLSVGNAITAWQGFKGACVLGKRGIRAEDVANEAVTIIEQESGDVDIHLADQLLVYAALAEGLTRYTTKEISAHLETNQYVISHFVDRKIELSDHTVFVFA
jgi:RNA 3'-terminal phosphate cyclase (ATP)